VFPATRAHVAPPRPPRAGLCLGATPRPGGPTAARRTQGRGISALLDRRHPPSPGGARTHGRSGRRAHPSGRCPREGGRSAPGPAGCGILEHHQLLAVTVWIGWPARPAWRAASATRRARSRCVDPARRQRHPGLPRHRGAGSHRGPASARTGDRLGLPRGALRPAASDCQPGRRGCGQPPALTSVATSLPMVEMHGGA